MKSLRFPALFLLLFIVTAGLAALWQGPTAYARAGAPQWDEIRRGIWPARFEKLFNETLIVYEPVRRFWGRAEYTLLGQGRKGVVVGQNGWLFSDEEFACPHAAATNLQKNLDFVKEVAGQLSQHGVQLVVALVPAKNRIYQSQLGALQLTSCRQTLYSEAVDGLTSRGVTVVNLLGSMQAALTEVNTPDLYLHTDTHWTPAGASLAARTIAATMPKIGESLSFRSRTAEAKPYEGDLLRYLPGVTGDLVAPDQLAIPATEAAAAAGGDLFGESVPAITLVGTSYSANANWNFEGALKTALKADVLNVADEGQGPFTVMDAYLASPTWQQTPPKLVIWEMPERYFLSPHVLDHGKATTGAHSVF